MMGLRGLCIFLALAVFGGSAFAAEDWECQEMWFARNAIFAEAGFCFKSRLGRNTFGNDGCIGSGITLPGDKQALVNEIKRAEARFACKIDNKAARLTAPTIPLYRLLKDFPLRDDTESGCIGYLGGEAHPIYAGKSVTTRRLSSLKKGVNIVWAHNYDDDGWDFITVSDGKRTVAVGWVKDIPADIKCEMFAG